MPWELASSKRFDLAALLCEAPQVLPWPPPRDWELQSDLVLTFRVEFWEPPAAKAEFLRRFQRR